MSIQIGKFNSNVGIDTKKAAIEAAKAKAAASAPATSIVKYIKPEDCADRTRIVFDDSGSMGGYIKSAKDGVVEYLRNCIPNQSSVGIHFMNTVSSLDVLTSDLPKLATDLLKYKLQSGGTPFFNTLKLALEATPKLTRLVAFTDGAPTDRLTPRSEDGMLDRYSLDQWKASVDIIIEIANSTEPKIPIDTVFFGDTYSMKEMQLLKYLSEKTEGFFLHFDPSKPNIWKQLKYLAPVNRLALTDGSFRAKVERGE